MNDKYKFVNSELSSWRNKVLEIVKSRVNYIKRFKKPYKTNPVLKDPEVINYLQKLHDKFVIVPIDKAQNNIAFVCKTYYIEQTIK